MKKGERKPIPKPTPQERKQLYEVLTINEVANGWHKHYKTVQMAVNQGRLCARQAGQMYLISFQSVVRLWGEPLEREEHSF